MAPACATKGSRVIGLHQSLATDPITDLEIELKEPVDKQALARVYGLDLSKLTELQTKNENDSATRSATRELNVFQGIVDYLETSRKQITRVGNIFQVKVPQLPCRILAIERIRLEARLHSNHKFKHDFTDVGVGFMYRCPLPGCGGAVLNQQSVRRALLPHCRIYHQTADVFRFTFHIEAKRGPEVLLFPPVSEREAPREDTDEPESIMPTEPATLDLDLTPLTQSTTVTASKDVASESPRMEGDTRKKKTVIDIDTQFTQPNQDILSPPFCENGTDFEKEQSSVSPDNHEIDATMPSVSKGYKGTGVHKLNFSTVHGPVSSEYATPIAHFAKRKRGPKVVAPNKMLHRDGSVTLPINVCPQIPPPNRPNPDGAPEFYGNPTTKVSLASSDATLGNKFVPGGHLNTVPKN